MEITLGDIVFGCGSTGGGGGSVSSSHPLPNGIKFIGSTWETFDCGKYDWSQIYDASGMFSFCLNLKQIDNFPKNEINGCVDMFERCTALESIPNGINLKPYYTIENMFKDCTSLTEIPYFDTSKVYSFYQAWQGCSSLTEFPQIDASKVTDFRYAWDNCKVLTTFPQLDLSSGTNFNSAWSNCSSLTEFPQLDLSSGTNFNFAWSNCYKLASLPVLDLSAGTNFYLTWNYCNSLTTLGGFGAIKESIDLQHSTKLTVESIMNVITQAADLNSLGITGKTMTFGGTNLNKLTDEQKAVATNKGWTLA